jgi:hypothetical protein
MKAYMLIHLFHNLFTGYLDAGLAAMVFQMLIAFFLGSLFIFKTFWSKVLLFFAKLLGIKQKVDEFGEDITDNPPETSMKPEEVKADASENQPETAEISMQVEKTDEGKPSL